MSARRIFRDKQVIGNTGVSSGISFKKLLFLTKRTIVLKRDDDDKFVYYFIFFH